MYGKGVSKRVVVLLNGMVCYFWDRLLVHGMVLSSGIGC